jgi:hypothetical protein
MDHVSPRDRRLDRRIPIGCSAHIRVRDGGEVDAECIELSVSGMTLHTAYAPADGDVIEVMIETPDASVERPPLVTRLRVTRCNVLPGGHFEVGGSIVRVVG